MTSTMQQIQARGKLRVGLAADLPVLKGFEEDLARLFSTELFGNDQHIEFVQLKIIGGNSRVDSLKEDRVDLIIAQFIFKEERRDQVEFSIPYYHDKVCLLVLKESAIRGLNDLKGKKIAVEDPSTTMKHLQKDFSEAELVIVANKNEAFEALLRHKVEAYARLYTHLILATSSRADKDRFVILGTGDRFSSKDYTVGVQKGRLDLLKFVNECIKKYKSEGTLTKLLKKHRLLQE